MLLALVGCAVEPEKASPFRIDAPFDAKAWEKTAVSELGDYLGRVALSGKVTVGGRGGVVFHIGDTAFAASKGMRSDAFADEEWAIRSFGSDVVLNGGGTRGCLYAVYRFLEDFCDVRWWMDGDEDVPDAKPLAFPALNRRGKPHFFYRDIYRSKKDDFRTAVRNRLNGNGDSRISPEFGGGEVFGPPYHCHTWRFHVPWEKYGAAHPEYFALLDGKRTGGKRAQLCLSNPDLPKVMAESVEGMIAKGEAEAKAKGLRPPRLYDMSMNDARGKFCTCDACTALQEKYGHSGYQLLFENKVAGLLAAKHPDLLFSVFAYYESEAVPKGGVRAADNLVVKLCNTTQNMAAGIEEPVNRFMYDQVASWRRYAKNLFIWEYAITFEKLTRGMPFASEFHWGDKLRYYADNGVCGLLVEHEEPGQGDLYELKYHVMARFLEDPTLDPDRVIADFMRRYYGAAGAKILAARRHLDRIRKERGAFVTWCPRYPEFAYVDRPDIAEMTRLWDEAEAAVKDDPKRLGRVRRSREGFDRLCRVKEAFFACRKPPEAGVSDKPFIDCPASTNTYLLAGKDVAVVDDPEASTGRAIRLPFTNETAKPPFQMGVYCQPERRTVRSRKWDKPLGDGYRWYEISDIEFPKVASYVYLTRGWSIQIGPSLPEIMGAKGSVKVRVRFADDALYVDRTVFVP